MNSKKQIGQTIFLILVFAICLLGCKQKPKNQPLTEEQIKIIEIATKKAKSDGIDLKYREVYYDVGNEAWTRKLDEIKKNSPDYAIRRNYFKILDAYDYQAVLLALKTDQLVLGGDIWVFVDKKTGEVITIHGEQ